MEKLKYLFFIGMSILMINLVSSACAPTWSAGILTIPAGNDCTTNHITYIISSLVVTGTGAILNITNEIRFHKTGGTGDTIKVKGGGRINLKSGNKITSATSSGNCNSPNTYTGCPNEACMNCVCNYDAFCCGDIGLGVDMGFWDDICISDILDSGCSGSC
jgi:hypothetical protein